MSALKCRLIILTFLLVLALSQVASSDQMRRPLQANLPKQQQQPTVMTNNQGRVITGPSLAHFAGPMSRAQFQPLAHLAHHRTNNNNHHQRQQSIEHLPTVCQIPDELKSSNKCQGVSDSLIRSSAIAEFKLKLEESSLEVRQLLSSHLYEFRTLALGLVLVAKNDTLNRLRANFIVNSMQPVKQATTGSDRMAQLDATRRLFEAMYSHLVSYHQHELSQRGSELAGEIQFYFRRLHAIQLKRALETRAEMELDLDCLDLRLTNQQRTELLLGELLFSAGGEVASPQLNALQLEQAKLSLAIRQSLDYAKTLLSSLALSSDMFTNLTSRLEDWMPSQSCHSALARLTVCQQCSPPAVATPTASLEPCENYCLNVARGCMNDLFELNRFWSEHLGALAHFKTNMIQTNNIENVMSQLDTKLWNFMLKLQQHYNTSKLASFFSSSSSSQSSEMPQLALELIKLCPKRTNQPPPPPVALGLSGAFRTVASAASEWLHAPRFIAASTGQLNQQAASRPASKTLPATQHKPLFSDMSEAALRARASPALSLFNRLDGLVHQLQAWRDFFQEWPQRFCLRLRMSRTQVATGSGHFGQQLRRNSSSSGECWNGRDFSGYNKPLVQFGLPISAGHPELSQAQAQPISPMVLNLVARLKELGAQLARKSVRSASQMALLAELPGPAAANSMAASALAAAVATGPMATEGQHSDAETFVAGQPQRGGDIVEPDGEAAESEGEPSDDTAAGVADSDDQDQASSSQDSSSESGNNNNNNNSQNNNESEEDDDSSPTIGYDCKSEDCHDILISSSTTTTTSADGELANRLEGVSSGGDLSAPASQDHSISAHHNNQIGGAQDQIGAPKYQVPSVNVAFDGSSNNELQMTADLSNGQDEQHTNNQLIQVPAYNEQTITTSSSSSSNLLTLAHLSLLSTVLLAAIVLAYKCSLAALQNSSSASSSASSTQSRRPMQMA